MSAIRTAPFNGGVAGWGAAQNVQVDSVTRLPRDVPDGFPGRMEWVPDPLGERGTVLMCQLGPDPGATTGNRCEVNFPGDVVTPGAPVCRWQQWACMIPSEGFIADDRYFAIAQIHTMPDSGGIPHWPNFVLYAGCGELVVMLPRSHPPIADAGSRIAARYPLVRDKWMTMRLGANLAIEPDVGWIDFAVDGRIVLRERGHGTAYADMAGPRFKVGIYNIFHHVEPGSGLIARAYFSGVEQYSRAIS